MLMTAHRPSSSRQHRLVAAHTEPRWKTVERVVALIEKALEPSARIEHNIFLPVIGRPDREPRQCDIVITYNDIAQTKAIVEVQDRKSKPDITMFHGWVKKMQEVGAQNLICVSALGFPQSIKNDVLFEYGPTVRLMTLRELKEPSINKANFLNQIVHTLPRLNFSVIGPSITLQPTPTRLDLRLSSQDKVFSIGKDDELFSLFDLAEGLLDYKLRPYFEKEDLEEPINYTIAFKLYTHEEELYIHIDNNRHLVIELPVVLEITNQKRILPITYFKYKREISEGKATWIGIANGEVEGKKFSIEVVFHPDDEHILRVIAIQATGVKRVGFKFYKNINDWIARQDDIESNNPQ